MTPLWWWWRQWLRALGSLGSIPLLLSLHLVWIGLFPPLHIVSSFLQVRVRHFSSNRKNTLRDEPWIPFILIRSTNHVAASNHEVRSRGIRGIGGIPLLLPPPETGPLFGIPLGSYHHVTLPRDPISSLFKRSTDRATVLCCLTVYERFLTMDLTDEKLNAYMDD